MPSGEVVRAEWLSSTGRVLLIALVDNRERYRVECDEEDVDRMRRDLEYHLAVQPRPARRRARGARSKPGFLSLVASASGADGQG